MHCCVHPLTQSQCARFDYGFRGLASETHKIRLGRYLSPSHSYSEVSLNKQLDSTFYFLSSLYVLNILSWAIWIVPYQIHPTSQLVVKLERVCIKHTIIQHLHSIRFKSSQSMLRELDIPISSVQSTYIYTQDNFFTGINCMWLC